MTAIRNGGATGDQPQFTERPVEQSGTPTSRKTMRDPLEGEIHDLVRRKVAPLRRLEPETTGEPVASHTNDLVRRVSVASLAEIDRVIGELNGVREMLRTEGERVTREIAGFASLNHAAVTSMRVIADSLAEWKNGAQIRHEPRH